MKKRIISLLSVFIVVGITLTGVSYWSESIIRNKIDTLYYNNNPQRNFNLNVMSQIVDENNIIVFGSSELSSEDNFGYPRVLFNRGNSDFNMILVGSGLTQSLQHSLDVGCLDPIIKSRKVVFIISPQWFDGSITSKAFASRFSERSFVGFIRNGKISDDLKKQVVERVKKLLADDPGELKRVIKYEKVYLLHEKNPISIFETLVYDWFTNLKENYSFAKNIKHRQNKADSQTVHVEDIDFSGLMDDAVAYAQTVTDKNDLNIDNDYYDEYVKPRIESGEGKGAYSTRTYLESDEYIDINLFIDVCNEIGIEPLMVSIPVNGKWYDYAEFSKEDREQYYQNIRDICKEKGVRLLDYSSKEYEDYFLKDIMHLGWKGWIYLDEAVYKFNKGE